MKKYFLFSFILLLTLTKKYSYGQSSSLSKSKSPISEPSLTSQQKYRCLSNDPNKLHPLFGTKTTYTEAVKLIKKSSDLLSNAVPPQCQAVSFYLFKRHGIRYPDGENIPEIENLLEELKNQLVNFHSTHRTSSGQPESPVVCEEDVEMIRKWRINMKESDDNLITDTGATEIASIGK